MEIKLRPIGFIRSPFADVSSAPPQSCEAMGVRAKVELLPEFADCVDGLENFSHIILIYYMHLCDGYSARVVPRGGSEPRGVFSTRAPARPNPIGLSLVKLVDVDGCTLTIEGIDAVDGTPLLDIKPFSRDIDTI